MIFLAWCLPQLVFAETTIKASVDKTSVTTDDIITYTLEISSGEKAIPDPTLPHFEHFSILKQVQTNNLSVGEKGVTSSVTFQFALAPAEAGTFIVEPAQIKVKDQVYKSEAFTIEVKPGTARPSQEPQELPPESDESQTTL